MKKETLRQNCERREKERWRDSESVCLKEKERDSDREKDILRERETESVFYVKEKNKHTWTCTETV